MQNEKQGAVKNKNKRIRFKFFSDSDLQAVYTAVFRDSIEAAGFYFFDFGDSIDSITFRQYMIDLKVALSELSRKRINQSLNYQWIGRFNHQHSSQFHRDNTTDHSILMLGYEPTEVASNVYLADYMRLLENNGRSLLQYFEGDEELNIAPNEEELAPYITKLKPFPKSHYRLVVVNNSKSFEQKSFGVFHRGEVFEKNDKKARIINSIMLRFCDPNEEEQYDEQAILNFVRTDEVLS